MKQKQSPEIKHDTVRETRGSGKPLWWGVLRAQTSDERQEKAIHKTGEEHSRDSFLARNHLHFFFFFFADFSCAYVKKSHDKPKQHVKKQRNHFADKVESKLCFFH